MDQIEIARFADVFEAEIAAARLRAEGLTPSLGGIEHMRADPLLIQALGWARMTVPEHQVEAARGVLSAVRAGEEALAPEAEADPADPPDRKLPARVTLIGAVLALLSGG